MDNGIVKFTFQKVSKEVKDRKKRRVMNCYVMSDLLYDTENDFLRIKSYLMQQECTSD